MASMRNPSQPLRLWSWNSRRCANTRHRRSGRLYGVETLSGTLLDQADAAHAGATLLRERSDRASADTLERQQQIAERFEQWRALQRPCVPVV
jgi:hypothetical protein